MHNEKEGKTIIGKDIAFNRKVLESKETKILILQHKPKKEGLKQRESGLNQVLCKIAKDNNKTLAFDLNELKKEKDKKTKAEILSRMLQNIKLTKKFKNKFKLLHYKNKQQAFSFLLTLGLPTNIARKAVS